MTVSNFLQFITLEQLAIISGLIGTLLLAYVVKVNPYGTQTIDGDPKTYHFALVRSNKMFTGGVIYVTASFILLLINSLV